MNDEERIRELFKRLNEIYTIRTFHDHDPYKVLVRTILSQRTRDENTDQAANALFDVYHDIYAVSDAPVEHVQELIRPAGFYRVKAARILEVSRILIDQYGGEVPREMDEMLSEVLPLYSEWMTEEEASLALCVPLERYHRTTISPLHGCELENRPNCSHGMTTDEVLDYHNHYRILQRVLHLLYGM